MFRTVPLKKRGGWMEWKRVWRVNNNSKWGGSGSICNLLITHFELYSKCGGGGFKMCSKYVQYFFKSVGVVGIKTTIQLPF